MKAISLKNYFFLFPVAILLIIQIPNLIIPYFWDEAWSYITAIAQMAEAGPGLLPGILPIEGCKGHPQFFYFISASWMNLYPGSIPFMRILPLIVSVSVLLLTYFELKKLTSIETANIATLLVAVQSTFLAQSILVLPEMLLCLLLVVSFFSFLNKKFVTYAIAGSLMVLTKETAIVYAFIIGLFYIFSVLKERERNEFRISHLISLLLPGIVYGLFLILHFAKFGIFFFSEHLDFMDLRPAAIFGKIGSASALAFSHYGRMLILIMLILSLIILAASKKKIEYSRALILIALCTISGLLFLSVNFYSPRYTLSLTILFIIAFSIIFGQLTFNRHLKTAIILLIASVGFYYSLSNKRSIDSDMGYIEVIKVHQEMVNYAKANNFYNEPIATSFNMGYNLKNKELGYIQENQSFTKIIGLNQISNAKYVVFESTINSSEPVIEYSKSNFKLVKSFSLKHAWGYIYENPEFKTIPIP
jgi:4-amino-4-deoxy-L-arabinose transferase-like glycosyltransferase